MKSYLAVTVVVAMLFCAVPATAQCPDTLWTRSLGGVGEEWAFDFCFSEDDGIVVVGREYRLNPNGQTYVLKLTSVGDTSWIQYYGDRVGMYPKAIVAGQIGEYYVVGAGGGATTMKINAVGDTIWAQRFLAPDDADVDPYKVCRSEEGGCAVVCRRIGIGPHLAVLRYSEDGDLLWYRCYGGSALDFPCGIHQTADRGYLLTSSTFSSVDFDQVYLVRISAQGDSLWSRSVGGMDTEWPQGSCLTADGGAVIVGYYIHREDTSAQWDAFALRVDSAGQFLWERVLGGTNTDQFWAVQQTNDGGFVCAGHNSSFPASGTLWLAKLSTAGDSLWSCGWGGNWYAYSVHQASDGGYVTAGTGGQPSDLQGIVIRTAAEASSPRGRPPVTESLALHQNFPNPFNGITQIEFTLPSTQRVSLRLYDVLGREVAVMMNEIQTAGRHEMMFDASGLPSGAYLCRLEAGGLAQTRKVALVK